MVAHFSGGGRGRWFESSHSEILNSIQIGQLDFILNFIYNLLYISRIDIKIRRALFKEKRIGI
ncbi:hypothetical protein LEP1GSC137_2501 [Leptospira borgpetersenii str. Noumea 25]|nr:hypothetical protein LEP1GSC137_2501 [Leptospira borgpetersenii str. Noumea 25]